MRLDLKTEYVRVLESWAWPTTQRTCTYHSFRTLIFGKAHNVVPKNGPVAARGRAREQRDSHRVLHYNSPWPFARTGMKLVKRGGTRQAMHSALCLG